MLPNGVGIDWLRYAGSVVIVILLLLAMLWILRRMKSMQSSQSDTKRMQLLETISVGPRQKICLLRVGATQVLVGITANQFTALGSWPDAKETKGDNLAA
jgi:flagellar protein FliO/FliZ